MAETTRRPLSSAPAASGAGRGGRARESEGLWHRPLVLNLIADVLMMFAALGLTWAAVSWLLARPFFPLREVVLLSPPAQVTSAQLEYVARAAIHGNFFTVDLDQVRADFEKLPWVRRAEVRRRWPDTLELRLQEHQAVAYWTSGDDGDTRLVNRQGEVFVAASNARLPSFAGPQGSAAYVLAHYESFVRRLAPLGHELVGVVLSAREAWQLRLDNDMVIVLGREQDKAPLDERLARFVAAWPQAREGIGVQVAVADLRYPSGFALTPAGTLAMKGKQ
ncbi:cell division protein FtsQ/DivIB [Pseudothauera nasutitermitis]